MESQAVVETLLGQGLEVFDRLRCDGGIKLDHDRAAIGVENRIVASVAHGYSIEVCGHARRRGQKRHREHKAR
jgi:hypothetical protein